MLQPASIIHMKHVYDWHKDICKDLRVASQKSKWEDQHEGEEGGQKDAMMDYAVRTWVSLANVFRFAAYKQNIFKCASRAAYKFNCHIRLCPARVVVVAPAGCGVSSRVASWQIPRVVVAAMVTRLLQLILKIKSFFGGCFNPQRGRAERGVIWPRLGRSVCRWQYPAPLALVWVPLSVVARCVNAYFRHVRDMLLWFADVARGMGKGTTVWTMSGCWE